MNLTSKQKELLNLLNGVLPTAPAKIAEKNSNWYRAWVYGESVIIGDRRRDEYNGLLYEVYAAAGDNLYPPHKVPAVWRRVYEEEWPEWVQPLGGHDVYKQGAKVTHKGTKWISDVNNNSWEPGVYGWSEYKGE